MLRDIGHGPIRPADFHGHTPDVMTHSNGKGGDASLGLPDSGGTRFNKVRAIRRGNVQKRRNKRR